MAQTNYTPIQLYYSSTASAVPVNTNLASGELAINITDGLLFYKDNAGTVQKIGYKLTPTTAGGTGLTSFTANGIVYASSTSALATGSALTFDGTTFTAGTATGQNGVFKTVIGSGGANEGVVIVSGTTGTGWLGFNNGNSANIPGQVTYNHSTGALSLYANAGPVIFSASGAEGMRLTSTGLGIGTSSPAYKLVVAGTAPRIVSQDTTNNYITVLRCGNTLGYVGTESNIPFAIVTNGNTAATFDTSGNLGIGTTTPNKTGFTSPVLSITNGTSGIVELIGTQTADGTIGQVAFYNTSSSVRIAQILGVRSGANNSGAITFQTNNAGTLGEVARITPSGNVGIGTTSPVSRLEIKDTTNNTALTVTSSYEASLQLVNGGGSEVSVINAGGSNILSLRTANNEKARIDSSGNLLVGTTTAAGVLDVEKAVAAEGEVYCIMRNNNGTKINSLVVNSVATQSYNTAVAALWVGRASANGRGLNAGGTINASGADYAEYMTKAGNFTIAKGDVVGIDAQGKLTNVFDNAVSFMVKSTDPSYVGGDTWGTPEALGLSVPEKPSQRQATEEVEAETDEEFAVRFAQYEADKDAFDAALEAARQRVDRIAFAGQVPVNVTGATAGQYIIPVNDNGAIKGEAVSNPTFEQYQIAVGKVIAIESDGRAKIIVKVA